MQKKQWLIIGLIILIISIISIVFVSTLAGISTPTVTVKIDAFQISEKNVSINVTMELDNQNPYDLILNDLNVELISSQNKQIGLFRFSQKTVPSHGTISLQTIGLFDFKGESLDEFKSHITGDFGVQLFGVYSFSLPINIKVITDPSLAINAIVLPTISLNTDINSVNESGVKLNGTIIIDNQNDFSISLLNPLITINHNQTIANTHIIINNAKIKPQSETIINFTSFVGYELFNIGKISATIESDINITIAGTSLTRPFTASAEVNIPDITTFILNNERIEISLSADFDLSLSGLNMNVGFKVYNPTDIPLTASELDIIIYRVDNNTKTLITQDTLRDCPISTRNETCLKTTFNLPILSFIPLIGDGIPDWFLLTITGDFTIADSNQKIPIQLNGFVDGNLFSTDTLNVKI